MVPIIRENWVNVDGVFGESGLALLGGRSGDGNDRPRSVELVGSQSSLALCGITGHRQWWLGRGTGPANLSPDSARLVAHYLATGLLTGVLSILTSVHVVLRGGLSVPSLSGLWFNGNEASNRIIIYN